MRKIALSTLFVLTAGLALQAQTKWAVDKNHSNIGFTAVHYVITEVEGEFKEFEGTVTSTSDDFNGAEVNFVAKVASISTDNDRRDGHLKSDDFFNAEKYPEIKFGGKIEKQGKKHYLIGDFTMRDVTKPVKFDVKHNGTVSLKNGRKAGFKITGEVDRFEYGIKFDSVIETGGLAVSQEIQIICNVELNEETGS